MAVQLARLAGRLVAAGLCSPLKPWSMDLWLRTLGAGDEDMSKQPAASIVLLLFRPVRPAIEFGAHVRSLCAAVVCTWGSLILMVLQMRNAGITSAKPCMSLGILDQAELWPAAGALIRAKGDGLLAAATRQLSERRPYCFKPEADPCSCAGFSPLRS